MKKLYLLVGAFVLLPSTVYGASIYETPQYSGPAAQTNGGMTSPASPVARPSGVINNPTYNRAHLNDSAGEKFIERRNTAILKENQRRREEVIRKVKTNE